METYKIGEFAKKIGVCVKTLQRWDKEKILIANRTLTGRRFYTDKQYIEYINESSDKNG